MWIRRGGRPSDAIAPRVKFRPNLEMGFGDHLTTTALNFEGLFRFVENWATWSPYPGKRSVVGSEVGIHRAVTNHPQPRSGEDFS